MEVDFETFLKVIPYVIGGDDPSKNYPVMIRGRHGIGKSQLVYQLASGELDLGIEIPALVYVNLADPKTHEEAKGALVVERRASQMTEGDLMGLPRLNEGMTSWNPPDWVKLACERPVFLFMDELDSACFEVKCGFFELGDSRKLNGHTLHPHTLIFAATNSGIHDQAHSYIRTPMGPAELSRWVTFDVNPTKKDWLNWAKGKVSDVMWEFHASTGDGDKSDSVLDHFGEFAPNVKYPDRRAWVRLDNCLRKKGVPIFELDQNEVMVLTNAMCGEKAAFAFVNFLQNYSHQVRPEDILDKGHFPRS